MSSCGTWSGLHLSLHVRKILLRRVMRFKVKRIQPRLAEVKIRRQPSRRLPRLNHLLGLAREGRLQRFLYDSTKPNLSSFSNFDHTSISKSAIEASKYSRFSFVGFLAGVFMMQTSRTNNCLEEALTF
jgi:hypothetical protein